MSADSCALRLGISVRTYERVLRFKGHSRFALLSLLSWLLLMAQTTSTEFRKLYRKIELSDLDRAVADPTGRNISLTASDPTAGTFLAGPSAALDTTPSSADLELREDRRKIQLRASDQVIPHHNQSRQAPNPRERLNIWSCRCTSPLRVQTGW